MELLQVETDVGLIREDNEDVVLALSHPKDNTIKLLLAADGMGGKEKGEVASEYVSSFIKNWFLKQNSQKFSDLEEIQEKLCQYIKKINRLFIKEYGQDKMGTTLIVAIINSHDTLLVNVGDSRGYIYRKKKLIQLSEDASLVWKYYKDKKVRKDDLRFFASNSIVTSCIGIHEKLCWTTSLIIKNDYDMIFLLTDGVTDNITDSKMKKLIHQVPKRSLLSSFIHEAVYVDQHFHIPFYLKRRYLENFILPFPGRDNASGAIYIKEV